MNAGAPVGLWIVIQTAVWVTYDFWPLESIPIEKKKFYFEAKSNVDIFAP
jgi:hypothetical protein